FRSPSRRPAFRETLSGEEAVSSNNFLTELKRRNVYKVAVAYAVGAWLLIQVATQVFPFFDFPNWAVRLVVLLTIVGFPVAVVCSWAFELTSEGIKREDKVDRRRSITHRTGRKLTALIVVVAALAAGLMVFRFLHSQQAIEPRKQAALGVEIESKSIAVLPFENFSAEKANAYFAEGIQDEILTRLSKVADLKVISRTSTQHYKSAPDNLPEIAKQLGVAHILEGSVQKQGDRVRVNVQLIRAADDRHLWAEIFDRKLIDVFSVESEVAKAIADQLRVHLTGQEKQVMAAKPTDNPDAYDAYLRGLAYTLKTQNTPANYLGAQKYFREAVRVDPKFALAWALLSYVDARGYRTINLQPTVALREEARHAAETALALQPTLGEALVAKGFYHYGCLSDFKTAMLYYERARQFLPNSSRIPESMAFVARSQGEWERCESYFNEAERLDPRNVSLLTRQAQFYITLRRFPEALRKLDLILDIVPGDIDALVEKGAIAQAEGNLPRAAARPAAPPPAAGEPTG
ncbi:MAG: tetratricopeptide repeat protein, partial [Chthoniobacterales bacterium]